jgi:hypothetical protein
MFGIVKGMGMFLFAPALFYIFPDGRSGSRLLFPLYWIIEPIWQVSVMGRRCLCGAGTGVRRRDHSRPRRGRGRPRPAMQAQLAGGGMRSLGQSGALSVLGVVAGGVVRP